jgi:putative SOS response-associated peptidase YedK
MCFHYKQSKDAQTLQNRFKGRQLPAMGIKPTVYNGFQYPAAPVIANNNKESIQLYNWGLIPLWAQDNSIRQYTLNAKIETLYEKPAFKNCVNNRCLIIADSFTEWQWQDAKGKYKKKFEITRPHHQIFCFAGLWSEWVDKQTGELINTYTLVTTEANPLMAEIHNSKKRMPVILTAQNEADWLAGANEKEFAKCGVELIATTEEQEGSQFSLF